MEAKGYFPYYEDLEVIAEIDIRGRFMMMACDLEWSLFCIMLYCNAFNPKKVRRYKKMMMAQKIDCTIADLKHYNMNYFLEFEDSFDMLEEFKELRNYFGHCRMRFEESQKPSYFEVFYVDEVNGQEKILTKHFTFAYIKDAINRFRKQQMVFVSLISRLQQEFLLKNAEHQEFF